MGAAGTKAKAVIVAITQGSNDYLRILALRKASRYKRSVMKVSSKGSALTISIEANDITALRATMNSVLRDLQVASAILPIKSPKTKSIKRYISNK